jgi:hypothetical protein
MKTTFLQALDAEDKATVLRAAIKKSGTVSAAQRFEIDPNNFSMVYGSPFSYWVSDNIRSLFKSHPLFEQNDRIVRQGGVTGNDARYLRTFWEVDIPGSTVGLRWVPFAKGGNVSPWYADYSVVVAWDDQRETFFGYTGLLHRPSEKPSSADHYFRPGLTWPLRAARFAPVPLPRGSIFSIRGYAILAPENTLLALGAVGHSVLFDYIFKVALGRFGFPEFVVGVLQKLPLPSISADVAKCLADAAHQAWALKRALDTRSETSRAFVLPVAILMGTESIEAAAQAWLERIRSSDETIADIQANVDDLCFDLYRISEADRCSIRTGFGSGSNQTEDLIDGVGDVAEEDGEAGDLDGETESTNSVDVTSTAEELVAWAVGVAFGRFDIRLATGERLWPAEPEPFDLLPAYSPAMLTNEGGLPARSAPSGYPIAFPENGILLDDRGHKRDITSSVRAVFDEAFNKRADAFWNEASALVDPKRGDLGSWLTAGFAEYHLKRYTKSPRRAPIFWQIAVPSGRYSVWLYCHRLTHDSFFQIQSEYVTPKLTHEERHLAALIEDAGANPSAKVRKEIADQESFVTELRSFLDEIRRVAPLWRPTLDDGAALTMAPLWRLIPNYKAWQKDLKTKWDELAAGKYDWSHVAMHLWPERVVPKCAADRSLAIAHGLVEVFWSCGEVGKWRARPSPLRSVDELVRERTSIAVKAALRSLLDAPVASASGRLARRRGEVVA